MLIGLDATPLLGPRTGVGRYTAELLGHLPAALGDEDRVRATAFSVRGRRALAAAVPPGVSARWRPVPARAAQRLWSASELLPVGLVAGRTDVFHGTNFVLPPPGRSAGVVTVHDLAHLHLPASVAPATRTLEDLLPRSLARARAVCVPSQVVAGEVADAWPRVAERIVVTPLGVAPEWSTTPVPEGQWLGARGLRRPYVLFTGSASPRKGLQTLVSGLRLARERGADTPVLALAGPSGWGPELDLTGLPEGSVVRLGLLSDEDLRSTVAGASAVAYPSVYEGFGLPVLEAFACGVPVLASDIPTTREVLGEAIGHARLFPPGDVSAVAELLTAPWTEDPTAEHLRRSHARTHTWARTAELTRGAYELALGR